MKGDPGMGKTTLGKKMGYMIGLRGVFESVFNRFLCSFVFLKFVKPGESIENVQSSSKIPN